MYEDFNRYCRGDKKACDDITDMEAVFDIIFRTLPPLQENLIVYRGTTGGSTTDTKIHDKEQILRNYSKMYISTSCSLQTASTFFLSTCADRDTKRK